MPKGWRGKTNRMKNTQQVHIDIRRKYERERERERETNQPTKLHISQRAVYTPETGRVFPFFSPPSCLEDLETLFIPP